MCKFSFWIELNTDIGVCVYKRQVDVLTYVNTASYAKERLSLRKRTYTKKGLRRKLKEKKRYNQSSYMVCCKSFNNKNLRTH